jgi:hypothetical protein
MDGTPFGRYRLVALPGRGGMGEVCRAHDTDNAHIVSNLMQQPGDAFPDWPRRAADYMQAIVLWQYGLRVRQSRSLRPCASGTLPIRIMIPSTNGHKAPTPQVQMDTTSWMMPMLV